MPHLALVFRLWIWFTFRHMRLHAWRTLAVLLGIGLGAAVFTSVRLAVSASVNSFAQSMENITGNSDWSVVSPGGRVPERLVAELLKHPSVRSASPIMTTYVRIAEQPESVFLLIGLDPILDRPFRTWKPMDFGASPSRSIMLDFLRKPYAFVAGAKLCQGLNLKAEETVTFEHVRRMTDFHLIGQLQLEGLALVDGGEVALTDIASFQEFTGYHGLVDRIDILVKPGAGSAGIAGIRAILPPGVIIEQPSDARRSGDLMIRSYQLNLSVLSFVSLFVGMFLVYSLVALHARARRPELATLRSLGASSRLIFALFVAEGAFFGVLGWMVAMPMGVVLVRGLVGRVSSTISHLFVRVRVDQLALDPWEVFISFAVTLLVCLLAAAQPAREAMLVSPREAMLVHVDGTKRGNPLPTLTLFGILFILSVWPISQLPAWGPVPISGYAATFLLFLGFSLLSPWCTTIVGTVLSPWLRRFAGEPAYLGGRYVRDAGTRVAVSVGALITAVALFVGLVIMIHSFRSTVELWVNESVSGDLFLRPKMAEMNRYRDPFPEQIARALKDLQTPVALMPYRRIFLQYATDLYQFEAIDFDVFVRHARFLFIEGDIERILPDLMPGRGVLVSEVFANRSGLRVGDRYQAQVEGVRLDQPVLGIFRDYRTQGGVVYYSLPQFRALTGDSSWSGVRIFLHGEGKDGEAESRRLRNEILGIIGDSARSIEITTGRELHRAIMRIFDETFAVTTVLLLIALLVATLGITTTLTVLVLERTQQLHTLFAVGASYGQIRAMIFWESVLMVSVGELVGLACGFILSALLIFVINRDSFGWTFIYTVDWTSILTSLPLILATALLAALPAGQLLFKRPPAQVLKER